MNSYPTSLAPSSAPGVGRLASLDQFRGYTVLGMLLVNYFAGYAVCPELLEHSHDYCSYADTIMPQFLFAVGFAMRLTAGRRLQYQGQSLSIYLRMVRRLLGLVLVSLIVYHYSPKASNWNELVDLGVWGAVQEPLKRHWFQTLTHIAATSLWILPVIGFGAWLRGLWLIGSAALHVYLSYRFNFEWCNTAPNAIDGGPLGFLSWAIPALIGTFACDAFVPGRHRTSSPNWPIFSCLFGATFLMLIGYALSCGTRYYDVPADAIDPESKQVLADSPVWPNQAQVAAMKASNKAPASLETESGFSLKQIDWERRLAEPPFVKPPDAQHRRWNYWMMSQRAATISYLFFGAGFSLAVFVAFYIICDRFRLRLGLLQTFGTNALAAYIIHMLVDDALKPFFPKDSAAWYALLGLSIFFLVNWVCVRHLEKEDMYLRV